MRWGRLRRWYLPPTDPDKRGLDTGAKGNTVYKYSMPTLTLKQQRICDFIEKSLQTQGTVPTHQEIGDHFGFRSLNSVTEHLRLIRQKGFLESAPRKARSLRLTSPLTKLRSRIVDIPLYGSIPAGFSTEREQQPDGCITVDVASIGFKPTRSTFALRVVGDSMIGKFICDGDIAVFEHGPEPRPGQIVAALIDRKNTLKTFLVKNGKPFLKAENPKFPDLIPSEELVIQGVFRALIRRAKE
jgi:repressor LexA